MRNFCSEIFLEMLYYRTQMFYLCEKSDNFLFSRMIKGFQQLSAELHFLSCHNAARKMIAFLIDITCISKIDEIFLYIYAPINALSANSKNDLVFE